MEFPGIPEKLHLENRYQLEACLIKMSHEKYDLRVSRLVYVNVDTTNSK